MDVADRLTARVANGDYPDASEVVLDGLAAFDEREARIEDRLWSEVVPAYDALRADPRRAESTAAVRAALAADERVETP